MRQPLDYAALVKLLPVLRRLPDATGETTLTPEEAAKIRSFGFTAESGRWKCPPLPPQLTRDNPLLEPLSAGWEARSLFPNVSKSERLAEPRAVSPSASKPHRTPQHSVKRVEVPVRHCKVRQPVALSREEPDWGQIEKVASKIQETLERAGKPLRKRRLQQHLWRYPAPLFNAALTMLQERQRILLEIN